VAKKPKPAKISFTEANERIRAAGGHAWDGVKDPVRVIREMRGGSVAKRKPKPATAGTKIADEHAAKLTACGVRMLRDYWLARRIDSAIRRAVKNGERYEYGRWWDAVYALYTKGDLTRQQILAIRDKAEGGNP
jgi:hypothetical protein